MRKLKITAGMLGTGIGAMLLFAPTNVVADDDGGDCIRGSWVEDDECFGPLEEMCKGPPECFPED